MTEKYRNFFFYIFKKPKKYVDAQVLIYVIIFGLDKNNNGYNDNLLQILSSFADKLKFNQNFFIFRCKPQKPIRNS